MATIGYIGLGIMGRPAALNLARASHRLRVYARRKESLAPLLEAGAEAADTPAAMAEGCEFVVTNVSGTPDVREVLLGEGGVAEGAAPGTIVIDMSTISPDATREMAAQLEEKGIHLLDAPVSGGEKGAIDGTLSFMVGGKADVFGRALPVFQAMGANIVHVGESGAGQVVKACNQVVIGATIEGVAEAIRLAKRNGVDPGKMREALLGGFANSKVLDSHGMRMLNGDYAPGFRATLHLKDLRIARENARQAGTELPSGDLFISRLEKCIEDGEGDLDSTVVCRVLEREQ